MGNNKGISKGTRLVFSTSKLTKTELVLFLKSLEDFDFHCGDPLYPDHPKYQCLKDKTVMVNRTLTCDDPMSTVYYHLLDDDDAVTCAYCNHELSKEIFDKLNKRLTQVTTCRPCCGSKVCLARSVAWTKRSDGFIEKGNKPKKKPRAFKKRLLTRE